MKRFFIFCLAVLVASTAAADWTYVAVSGYPGYYYRTNGLNNDGYYYTLRSTCYNGCNRYEYVQYGPIQQAQAAAPLYNESWKKTFLKALEAKEERAEFDKLVAEHFPAQQQVATPYGYSVQGITTIRQGFYPLYAQQGSTVYGSAAYGAPRDDLAAVDEAQREQQRFAAQLLQTSAIVNNGVAAHYNARAAADTARSERAETLRAAAEVIKALAPAPSTTQTIWSSQPAQQQQDPQNPPLGAKASGSIDRLRAEVAADDQRARKEAANTIIGTNCLACHGGQPAKIKGDLDLTKFADAERTVQAAVATKIIDRLTRTDEKRMPPIKDEAGHPVAGLSRDGVKLLVELFRPYTAAE